MYCFYVFFLLERIMLERYSVFYFVLFPEALKVLLLEMLLLNEKNILLILINVK